MKSSRLAMLSICVVALCTGGVVAAKETRDSITILPGGAHVLYVTMIRGKTNAGKDALVFTGRVTLNFHKAWEANAIVASSEHVEVIPLNSQYNVFGPSDVRFGCDRYKSERSGALFTFFQDGRRGQMEKDWHKV